MQYQKNEMMDCFKWLMACSMRARANAILKKSSFSMHRFPANDFFCYRLHYSFELEFLIDHKKSLKLTIGGTDLKSAPSNANAAVNFIRKTLQRPNPQPSTSIQISASSIAIALPTLLKDCITLVAFFCTCRKRNDLFATKINLSSLDKFSSSGEADDTDDANLRPKKMWRTTQISSSYVKKGLGRRRQNGC